MKLKHVFLIFCLFGIGYSQLSGQAVNKSESIWEPVDWWSVPVVCDGVFANIIQGSGYVHYVFKYNKDGSLKWQHNNSNMTAQGWGGETFKYIEQNKYELPGWGIGVVMIQRLHFTLIGDQGSHYVGFWDIRAIWDGEEMHMEWTPGMILCK